MGVVLVLCGVFAALACPASALATTFPVTKTQDTLDGSCLPEDCSLREAVVAANADDAADTVIVPAGTYELGNNGSIIIEQSLTLTGAGARTTIIQGNGKDRVLDVDSESITVEISGVTVTGGGGVDQGAGIFTDGTLTIRDAAVIGNETTLPTTASSRQGAGIFTNGRVTAERVLISGNKAASIAGDSFAPQGAGFFANFHVSLTNVTITGNVADGTLGGSFGPQGAGLFVNDDSSLTNVTVAGNTAVDGDSQGGGIFYNDNTDVRHSIVAGNTGGGVPDECFVNDIVTSAGVNLATNASDCGFTAPADISADPLLGALSDNGGTSNTRALGAGSPAIDRVPFGDCPALDQRGFARAGAGTACDLGAHEVGAPFIPPAPPPAAPPAAAPPPPPAARLAPQRPRPKAISAKAAFTLPSTKRCVSRRSFRIRIRKVTGVKFVSATVTINGKRVDVLRGRRLTVPVSLKGQPAGRFTVKITALASDGRRATVSSRYTTCKAKAKPKTRKRAPKR